MNPLIQLTEEDKALKLEQHFEEILKLLGLDLTDPELIKTPKRMAKMYLQELFSGLHPQNFPELAFSDFSVPENEGHMVIVKDISIYSVCLHHFLPFLGTCVIGYVPNRKILGLSKINRIVDYFCRRPQLQEKLTRDLSHAFSQILETEDVAILIKATHLCVTMRGIKDQNSKTITHNFRGNFLLDPSLKEEFLLLSSPVE